MTLNPRPSVVIFRDHLLPPSETFIRAQAASLQSFSPVFAGSRRVRGLDLPTESTYVINQGGSMGKAREVLFKLVGTAPNLVRSLRKLNPALVHAHFGSDGLRALPLAAKLHLPLVVTFHGSDATVTDLGYGKSHYGHRRYLANRHVLQKGASQLIAVSRFVQCKLLSQGFPPEKLTVHYIGVDTELFAPRTGERDLTVLFVGRFVERKGVDYLIRAMADVQKDCPEAGLVLIGDGPLRKELEAQAKDSLRRYRFLGIQSPDVVRAWMDQSAIFCSPSVQTRSGEEEAFGMVFAEAQALEKPVVSFASGGIPEAVGHNETGLLTPERDWQAMAKDLSLLLRNPQLRRDFGRAGRKRVLQLFDLRKQTRGLEKIYDTVSQRTSKIYPSGVQLKDPILADSYARHS